MRMALQGLGVRFRTCYRQKSSRNSLRDGTINGLDSKRVLSTFKENRSFKELPYFGFMFYLLWIPFEPWKSGRPSEMGLLWIQVRYAFLLLIGQRFGIQGPRCFAAITAGKIVWGSQGFRNPSASAISLSRAQYHEAWVDPLEPIYRVSSICCTIQTACSESGELRLRGGARLNSNGPICGATMSLQPWLLLVKCLRRVFFLA
ncbi:hypothetical protein ARMSODRAFT_327257 [Armillaria solidipes]|uniref:Uncharacterized protein n=1 Tax=Armillaria solidipes TaxID=1076256 RepID=A0A2H3BRT8_9AGAR|nr:hypothetical protein ARMSODRAFT_327257 [Armillaria solidipes]